MEWSANLDIEVLLSEVRRAIKDGALPSGGAFDVLAKEITSLRSILESDAPDGHKVTNEQFVNLRLQLEKLTNPHIDSTALLAEADERFFQLRRKGYDQGSFVAGYLEGRAAGWTVAPNDPKTNPVTGCYCDFTHHMTGDGCEICNPEYAKKHSIESDSGD